MSTNIIEDKIEALKAFENRLFSFTKDVILENEHIISDMNARGQLYEQGITRDGDKIAEYRPYRPITIQIKRMKGQPTSRVTLYDEGDFHASFRVIAGDTSFLIDATDFKTESLIAKYGEQILGLTDDNLNELIWEYIYPEIMSNLKNLLA